MKSELGQEPLVVGIESCRSGGKYLRWAPPSEFRELVGVRNQWHLPVSGEDEPQTHIGVAMVDAAGHRDGDETRARWIFVEAGRDAKFLAGLPSSSIGGILVSFDVPARRKPSAGVDMADQEAAAIGAIDDRNV